MSPEPGPTHAFDDLVEESLDEAAFLWGRWESELFSLTRSLDEIWSWTEDRLHGALDGVRAAGPRLVDVASSALASEDVHRAAAGAALLGSATEAAATDALVSALRTSTGPALRAIVRGLELRGSSPALRAGASVLTERATPECAAALCRLKAFLRVAPGPELAAAFRSDDPGTQADAIRAARHLPPRAADEWIQRGLDHADSLVRHAAFDAGAARGPDTARRTAVALASPLDANAGPALRLIALIGTEEDHDLVYSALRIPALQRDAIWALGHIGTAQAVDACLAGMKHEQLARACGETYCWITGADLARDALSAEEPAPDAPAFEDDNLDANLVPPPEALWPLPDATAVRAHWEQHRTGMNPAARHVRGVVASSAALLSAIETGPMLRRHDLALELRVRSRGRYDVETRAFTARQRQMMAAGRAALSAGEDA